MNILISPDSFKGTASSSEVALAAQKGVLQVAPKAICDLIPIADGGEGSLDALQLAIGGQRQICSVIDARHASVDASYLRAEDTAFVELAMASGLPQLSIAQRDPKLTTTLGTGQLIHHALSSGAREIVVCIGGSATNDAGLGIAHALGITFLDADGLPFLPTGGTLTSIKEIRFPTAPIWDGIRIVVLCDVNNPFIGPTGAVATFAPQKGATAKDMILLEGGMVHLAKIFQDQFGINVIDMPGAGAAGGVGGGLHVLLNASLVPGLSYIAEKVRLAERMENVDLVITGEGKLDQQSARGKVIAGIITIALEHEVPVVAICGAVDLTSRQVEDLGLLAACSVQKGLRDFAEASKTCLDDISYCTSQVIKLIQK